MCPREGCYSHLLLVLAFLITQIQNTWGISIAKRVTLTEKLNDIKVENVEKTFENLPTTHSLEDIQPTNGIRNTRKAPLIAKKGKKTGKNFPFALNNCNEDHVLGYGEATVIFSDDGYNAQRCRSTIISPPGTTIRLDCPLFRLAGDGCKKERVLVNEKGHKKIDFCKTESPDRYESSENNLALVYRRNAWKKGESKSPGFICKAMVIGEWPKPPPTVTSTTTRRPIYTWPSSTTETTTRHSTLSTWWPPGTYWTDQTWTDGTNNGWWSWNPLNTRTTTPSSTDSPCNNSAGSGGTGGSGGETGTTSIATTMMLIPILG